MNANQICFRMELPASILLLLAGVLLEFTSQQREVGLSGGASSRQPGVPPSLTLT